MARRKRRVNIPAIILLLLTLLIICGCVFIFYYGNQTMLRGEWQREIDITDYAVDSIASYLGQDMDPNPDSRLTINLTLSVNKDGEWKQTVDEASYDEALQQAKSVLTGAVSDSLKKKIEDSYINTDMTVDELVVDATGMSLQKYLDEYGPQLLPNYSELMETYGMSASYVATRDSISLDMAGEMTEFGYVVTKDIFVIDNPEETVIYHKIKSGDDNEDENISSETEQSDKEEADE